MSPTSHSSVRQLDRPVTLVGRYWPRHGSCSPARAEAATSTVPADVSHPSRVEVLVTSFGYLHGDAPKADVLVDVRGHLRDPHTDPAFRVLTGRDTRVIRRVLATPGAGALLDGLTATAAAVLPAACQAGRLVRVAVGCAGGRHRSVVIADAVAARLAFVGWGAVAEHLHVGEPLVNR
ncbi:MAG: ATPase [Actinomycetota bacterium]|nr:ATPase [Actinomycetota bacterium]